MTYKTLALSLALIPLHASLALAGADTGGMSAFHKAQSEPERVLNAILMREKTENEMNTYLMQSPSGKEDSKYLQIFTPDFKKSVLKIQTQQLKKNCGGKDKAGEVCGIDFSPVNCAQDVSDTYYLYKTLKSGPKEATIAYAWPKETEMAATYHMRKEGGSWKIDGVKCGEQGHTKFNMK